MNMFKNVFVGQSTKMPSIEKRLGAPESQSTLEVRIGTIKMNPVNFKSLTGRLCKYSGIQDNFQAAKRKTRTHKSSVSKAESSQEEILDGFIAPPNSQIFGENGKRDGSNLFGDGSDLTGMNASKNRNRFIVSVPIESPEPAADQMTPSSGNRIIRRGPIITVPIPIEKKKQTVVETKSAKQPVVSSHSHIIETNETALSNILLRGSSSAVPMNLAAFTGLVDTNDSKHITEAAVKPHIIVNFPGNAAAADAVKIAYLKLGKRMRKMLSKVDKKATPLPVSIIPARFDREVPSYKVLRAKVIAREDIYPYSTVDSDCVIMIEPSGETMTSPYNGGSFGAMNSLLSNLLRANFDFYKRNTELD
jgi:hypothetical protein